MSKTIAVMAVGALALIVSVGALASQSSSPFSSTYSYHPARVWPTTRTGHIPVDPLVHPGGVLGHGAGFLSPNAHNSPGSAGFEPKFTPGVGTASHGGLPGSAGQEPLYKMNGGTGHVHGGNPSPASSHVGNFNAPHVVPQGFTHK